nr:hypothetical protein [Tanacetum cinerariifolium]
PRPPSHPPRTEEVGPTTSTRPPSPTRHTSVREDISKGGGDFVSLPQSHEAPQTPAATALHTLARTSLGGDSSDTPTGHDAVEVPADTSMPSRNPSTTRRHLWKPFSSLASAYVSKNIPAGVSLPAVATTIPAGSSVDAAVRAAAAPSF